MENRRKILDKIAYYSFYTGVIIEVLLVLIDKSAYINPFEGRIFQITFLLFLIKVVLTKCSWKEWLIFFLFCVLGAVSYFVTGRNEIIRMVLFVAACKNIDMMKCLKLVFYMTLVGCVLIMLFSVTGIFGTVSLTQDYGRESIETRYTLGMGHPNALQCMVWALTTLGLYLYGEKLKWYGFLILAAVNTGFFLLTDSKTSLLVSLFVIALSVIIQKVNCKWIRMAGLAAGAIVTAFSIGISVFIAGGAYRVYDYVWKGDRTPLTMLFVRLNEFLNGRIRILVETDKWEGTISSWSLFSRPENTNYFDLGWVRLFYWYGIIPSCIMIAAVFVLLIYCYRKKNYAGIVLIVSFVFYNVIEAHAVSVYIARNYVLFLMGACFSEIMKKRKIE